MARPSYSSDKDIDRVVADLVKAGWTAKQGRHPKVTHPAGGVVTFSRSPSDNNACKNFLRDVRRLTKLKEQPPC
jgi:hypothetical protein